MTTTARLTHSRPRIEGLDVARALALFGIMGNHLMGADTTASWAIVRVMADFHAVAFALLIGCGVQLEFTATKSRGGSSWPSVVIRSVFLIVLGLLVGWWATRIAVILVTLGLLTLACRAVASIPTWALSVLTGASLVIGPLLTASNVVYGWQRPLYSPDFTDVVRPEALLALLVSDPYPFVAWLTYGLAGMLLVRLILTRPSQYPRIAGVAIIGAVLVLAIDLLTRPRASRFADRLLTWEAYSGSYVNVVSSALIVIAGVVLCCIVADRARGTVKAGVHRLAGIGQLTLTWYVVHIVVSDRAITPLENLPPNLAYLDIMAWIAQIFVVVVVSAAYLRHAAIGPLEAVPRLITRKLFPPPARVDRGGSHSAPHDASSQD